MKNSWFKRIHLPAVIMVACCFASPELASDQFDFLRPLMGQRPPVAQFKGSAQLAQALQQAEKGEVAESLQSVRDAFKSSSSKPSISVQDSPQISQSLMQLSKAWTEKKAPPGDVAELLRDIVLPPKAPGKVFPFPARWQLTYDTSYIQRSNTRLPLPESVGAELVRWSVLAKQSSELKKRLESTLTNNRPNDSDATKTPPKKKDMDAAQSDMMVARVLAIQLATAETDIESASKSLKTLIDESKQATDTTLEYLLHAVGATLPEPKLIRSALELLEVILNRIEQTQPPTSTLPVNLPYLRIYAARMAAKTGHAELAKKFAVDAVAKPMPANQYGTDYAAYLDYSMRQKVAGVLLDAGSIVEGLDLASVVPDARAARFGQSADAVNIADRVRRELKKLAPAERFELLKQWALPDAGRQAVRSVVDLIPNDRPSSLGAGLLGDVYSTNWELVTTARDLNKLDELIRQLSAITTPSTSVKQLLTLAMIVRDGSANVSQRTAPRPRTASDVSTRLTELFDETTAAMPAWDLNIKPQPPLETYVIASEAALHPEWRGVAESLLWRLVEHSQRTQSARVRDHFRMALTELLRLRMTGGPATVLLTGNQNTQRADGRSSPIHLDWMKLRPKMWDPISFESSTERSLGALPPTWFAHEGYLSHVSNGRESELVFEVPLSGSFEVSAECREGGWTEGKMGFGGIGCQIYAYNGVAYLSGTGKSGFELSAKMTNLLNRTPWNRYMIRVDGNSVRYFANGQLVFEDHPGTAAPWLVLGGAVGFTPTYRNLQISGAPTIPREVKLLDDSRLRGWVSAYFEESKPESLRVRRFLQVTTERNGQRVTQVVEDDGMTEGTPVEINQASNDWMLVEGELRSPRRNDFWGNASPSLLTYLRPLREGETLRYEFFQQAGQTTAAPAFGDVVYAIGHDSNAVESAQASPMGDRSTIDGNLTSSTTKGAAAALQDGWNSVTMSLKDATLSIVLNGKPIVSERIFPTNSRRIGFYHDAALTDLRVRNVVLTGNWPKTVDDAVRSALESPEPTAALPKSRFLNYAVNEVYISDNALAVFRRAMTLDAPQRYKFLHNWVMPNESHELLRMAGAFTPTHPAPPVLERNPIDVAMAEARTAVDHRLVQTGGNFLCPAILLVLAAAETEQLDDLKLEVLNLPAQSSVEMGRNRAAMLGIIALLQDQTDEVIANIWECHRLITNQDNLPQHARWGDVALPSLAIHNPATREAAIMLLERIQSMNLNAGKAGTPAFSRFVRQLYGQATFMTYGGVPEEFGIQPKTSQWRMVSRATAKSRGEGYPIASFDVVAGEMAQRGGHDFDGAYFQSPLRGNYEVRCRLTNVVPRESMVMAAGIATSLKETHNQVNVLHVGPPAVVQPIAMPITPNVQQWHDYKVIVKDGRYQSFINGQKLYEEELPEPPDPWLAIVGLAGNSPQAVRGIVITGNPEIPTELDLLAQLDLNSWMTNYYETDAGKPAFAWNLSDGELTCEQSPSSSKLGQLKVENIIRYHRPMLEDGEISYEFFYDPETKLTVEDPTRREVVNGVVQNMKRTAKGRTVVHPALDRLVCLLEPDGVKVHWLTDGRFDTTGLAAGNVEAVKPDGKAVELPFKPQDWNSIKFATKGDTLTVELNGSVVLTREIEPTNLRHFGLFHYANESQARVRNIRYRGDWPTKLPTVDQQDLARGPERLAEIPDADLPDQRTWDFSKSNFNTEEFRYNFDGRVAKFVTPTDAGLRFVQLAGEEKQWKFNGISPKVEISGDFIATIDYEGLKTVEAVQEWGSGLSFSATLESDLQTGVEVRHEARTGAKITRSKKSLYVANRPNYFLSESTAEFPTAGRVRIQRHGSVIYFFLAEPKSENFHLLNHWPLGSSGVKNLSVYVDASDKAAGSEFILKRMSIRAAKLTKVK